MMRTVFVWCFFQWVGEEAKGEDSGDCDCDCDCVVEWREGAKIAQGGYVLVGGGENSVEWISCRCFVCGYLSSVYS